MSYRSRILGGALVLLLASVTGCATTVVGALRAPVSDCTSHCNDVAGDDEQYRYACLVSCPGARYSGAGCSDAEPASVACVNDRRDDTAANEATARAVFGILDAVLEVAAEVHSRSCHYHQGH
jgi:hypothetical protein